MGAAAALTAMVIHSLVDFSLHLSANGIVCALIMGTAMRAVKDIPEKDKTEEGHAES